MSCLKILIKYNRFREDIHVYPMTLESWYFVACSCGDREYLVLRSMEFCYCFCFSGLNMDYEGQSGINYKKDTVLTGKYIYSVLKK